MKSIHQNSESKSNYLFFKKILKKLEFWRNLFHFLQWISKHRIHSTWICTKLITSHRTKLNNLLWRLLNEVKVHRIEWKSIKMTKIHLQIEKMNCDLFLNPNCREDRRTKRHQRAFTSPGVAARRPCLYIFLCLTPRRQELPYLAPLSAFGMSRMGWARPPLLAPSCPVWDI